MSPTLYDAARRPTIALLDIEMPGLGGIDVIREIAALDTRPDVIIYTGFSDSARLSQALDAGARGYVLKESPLRGLALAIRTVARGGIYVDPVLARHLAARSLEAPEPAGLTPRESDVLQLIADGKRNDQIAAELAISPHTVATHVRKTMVRLDSKTRTHAVATAMRRSLIR